MIRCDSKKLQAALKEMRKNLRDQRPVWRRVGRFMVFEAKKIIGSSALAPLASVTVKQKGHAQPLVKTGRLEKSLRSSANRRSVTVKADISYARYHQYKSKRLTLRKFIVLSDPVLEEIEEQMTDFLTKQLERSAR